MITHRADHGSRGLVLMADADAELRGVLAGSIENDGFEVVQFSEGRSLATYLSEAVLESARAARVRAVVLDARMTTQLATGVVEGMRNAGSRLPLILMSTHWWDALSAQVATLFPSALLFKPFELDVLRAALLAAIGDPEQNSATADPLLITIADPSNRVRSTLKDALGLLGHRCRIAADGLEALKLQRDEPADVILVDRLSPLLSGVDLCRLIRAEERSHYAYLILLSALSDKKHVLEGMRAGADDYLVKPVDFDELEACLVPARRVTHLHRRLNLQSAALRKSDRSNFTAARIDVLTGARNRRGLFEDLEALIASRTSPHAMAICDLDNFKDYNDQFGHVDGDRALEWVSEAIRAAIRRSDGLYRYGGEEFLILLPEQTLADALPAMERVRASIEALQFPARSGDRRRLTMSIGVAELFAGEALDSKVWVARADAALYRAKAQGRNRVEAALG